VDSIFAIGIKKDEVKNYYFNDKRYNHNQFPVSAHRLTADGVDLPLFKVGTYQTAAQ
jgi:hypothetical protein